jgi:hypothetical protein
VNRKDCYNKHTSRKIAAVDPMASYRSHVSGWVGSKTLALSIATEMAVDGLIGIGPIDVGL